MRTSDFGSALLFSAAIAFVAGYRVLPLSSSKGQDDMSPTAPPGAYPKGGSPIATLRHVGSVFGVVSLRVH